MKNILLILFFVLLFLLLFYSKRNRRLAQKTTISPTYVPFSKEQEFINRIFYSVKKGLKNLIIKINR